MHAFSGYGMTLMGGCTAGAGEAVCDSLSRLNGVGEPGSSSDALRFPSAAGRIQHPHRLINVFAFQGKLTGFFQGHLRVVRIRADKCLGCLRFVVICMSVPGLFCGFRFEACKAGFRVTFYLDSTTRWCQMEC